MVQKTIKVARRVRAKSKAKPPVKRNESPTRMRSYQVRLPKDIVTRLERVLDWIAPRIRTATGKNPSRADMFRAIMIRGLSEAEREFGLNEPQGKFVLVDED